MPLNYLSSSNAKDLDVMNVSKDLAELWFIVKELVELYFGMMSGGALQTPLAGEPSIPVLTFTCVPSLTNSMLPHVLCLVTCQAMSAILLPQDHEL